MRDCLLLALAFALGVSAAGCDSTSEIESSRSEVTVDTSQAVPTEKPAGDATPHTRNEPPEIRLVSGAEEPSNRKEAEPIGVTTPEESEFSLARFKGTNPVLLVLGEDRKGLMDLLSQFRKRLESNNVVVIEVFQLDDPKAKYWEGEELPPRFAQEMAARFPVQPKTATVVLLDAEGDVGIKEEGVTSPLALMLKLATYDGSSKQSKGG